MSDIRISGIVGLAGGALEPDETAAAVAGMARLAPADAASASRPAAGAAPVAGAVFGRIGSTADAGGVSVWLLGEIHNRDEVSAALRRRGGATRSGVGGAREAAAENGFPTSSDAALVAALFAGSFRPDLIAGLDGRFCAAVFDAARGEVHLLTDRLGDRLLFWSRLGTRFAWATTLGSFLAVPGFAPRIDRQALAEFLRLDHLLGERTWFEGVHVAPPGTILTFDLARATVKRWRYWWWDRMVPVSYTPDAREAAAEVARRFRAAVAARYRDDERVGVYLSGGLDSRAALAAATEIGPVEALTFGLRDCIDVQIARKVTARRGVRHHVMELTAGNWLEPRLPAVWSTGGMVNLVHLHGVEAGPLARTLFDVGLDGFGGDNIVRGDILQHRRLLDRFDRDFALAYTGAEPEWLGDLSSYQALPRTEYLELEHRARRLWSATAPADERFVTLRRPFSANAVVEFVYSLPDTLRYRGKLYRAFLLSAFPDLYRDIPWAATGVPISWPRGSGRLYRYKRRLESRLTGAVSGVGLPRRGPKHYADYPAWMALEPARGLIEQVLLDDAALTREYLPPGQAAAVWRDLLRGHDRSLEIGRLLTLEVWLRQVFTGRFRPEA